jgi:hypothetical protein
MSTFEDLALEHVGLQNQIIGYSAMRQPVAIGSWSKIPGKLIGEAHEPSTFRNVAGGTANELWAQSLVRLTCRYISTSLLHRR